LKRAVGDTVLKRDGIGVGGVAARTLFYDAKGEVWVKSRWKVVNSPLLWKKREEAFKKAELRRRQFNRQCEMKTWRDGRQSDTGGNSVHQNSRLKTKTGVPNENRRVKGWERYSALTMRQGRL